LLINRCQSFITKTAVDIYGQPKDSNNEKYDCPSCEIAYPASRFAPHLEKCLGLGRRLGRRLTASTSMDRVESPSRTEDDEDEFLIQPIEKKKKPKSSKKIKVEKVFLVNQHQESSQSELLLGDLVFDNQSLWGPIADTADDVYASTFMGRMIGINT
jgi:hypothetical protein